MKDKKIFLLMVLVTIAFVGCGKDKDAQQAANQVAEQQMALLRAVAANGAAYTGYLKRNGVILGGLQVNLTAVQPGGNSNVVSQSPTLAVELQFKSAPIKKAVGLAPTSFSMDIQAPNSYYDTSAGVFSVDFSLQRGQASGSAAVASSSTTSTQPNVRLSGTLGGGHLAGIISGIGYENVGGSFDLVLGGQSFDSLAENATEVPDLVFSQKNFTGQTTFQVNGQKPVQKNVNLILFKTSQSSEDDFLTMLVPVIPVTATLDYGADASFNFAANWDARTGKLYGSTVLSSTTNYTVSLSCDATNFKDKSGFQCIENLNNTPGVVATTSVLQAKNIFEPTQINSSTANQIQYVYKGEGQFQQGEWTPIQFTVTYAARTRTEDIYDLLLPSAEKTVSASFLTLDGNANSAVPVTFGTATWDPSSGTLNGQQTVVATGFQAQLSLACQNFYFTNPKSSYTFTCSYLSTARNFSGTLRLHN